MRRSVVGLVTVLALSCATFVAAPSALPQAAPIGTMQGTPNPATLGQTVTISNTAGIDSTCEDYVPPNLTAANSGTPGPVQVDWTATPPPGGGTVATGVAFPDIYDNWTDTFTPDVTGIWTVTASCVFNQNWPKAGNAPVAGQGASFDYQSLLVTVNQQATTTTTVAPTTTTTASAAASTAGAAQATTGAASYAG